MHSAVAQLACVVVLGALVAGAAGVSLPLQTAATGAGSSDVLQTSNRRLLAGNSYTIMVPL